MVAMLMKTNEFNYFEQTFMNLGKFFIQVFDDGVKDIKWSSLKVSKWLFITTTFITPLIACLLGSTFMNVNSKDFVMLVIPLLVNWGIFLGWLLFNLGRMLKISRKRMMVLVIVAVAISAAVNMMYIKRKPEINPELEYWNRLSNYSDDELMHKYLDYMDNDTNKASKALVMPKNTFVRLLEGTSKFTRYASTQIKNTLIESQCYGKDYILGSNRMDIDFFLNDSISNYLHPLWEMPKHDND